MLKDFNIGRTYSYMPSYLLEKKVVPNTSYVVDCFSYIVPKHTHYFLSHFHSDHYKGLKKSFTGTIYCSETTANLVCLMLKIPKEQIFVLEMHRTYQLSANNFVTCIDADHCPGAVCFLFCIDGKKYLHTGDFRASKYFYGQVSLGTKFERIFLDNTFENLRSFLEQRLIIKKMIEIILSKQKKSTLVPIRYSLIFATYLVGKEKLFLSAAEFFDRNVTVSDRKKNIYDSYSNYSMKKLNDDVLDFVRYAKSNIDSSLLESGVKAFCGFSITKNTKKAEKRIGKNKSLCMQECTSCKRTKHLPNQNLCLEKSDQVLNKKMKDSEIFHKPKEVHINAQEDILEYKGTTLDAQRITESKRLGDKTLPVDKRFFGNEDQTKTQARAEGVCSASREPFCRITTEKSSLNITVVSTFDIGKRKLNLVLENIKCERASNHELDRLCLDEDCGNHRNRTS